MGNTVTKKCFLHLTGKKLARHILLPAEVQSRFRKDKITKKLQARQEFIHADIKKPIQTVRPASGLFSNQNICNKIWLLRSTGTIWCWASFSTKLLYSWGRFEACLGLVRPFVSHAQIAPVFFWLLELTLQDHEAITKAYPKITKDKTIKWQPLMLSKRTF